MHSLEGGKAEGWIREICKIVIGYSISQYMTLEREQVLWIAGRRLAS
jgi:hypothetical protein